MTFQGAGQARVSDLDIYLAVDPTWKLLRLSCDRRITPIVPGYHDDVLGSVYGYFLQRGVTRSVHRYRPDRRTTNRGKLSRIGVGDHHRSQPALPPGQIHRFDQRRAPVVRAEHNDVWGHQELDNSATQLLTEQLRDPARDQRRSEHRSDPQLPGWANAHVHVQVQGEQSSCAVEHIHCGRPNNLANNCETPEPQTDRHHQQAGPDRAAERDPAGDRHDAPSAAKLPALLIVRH